MVTTASRVAKGRPTTGKPGSARGSAPAKGKAVTSPSATRGSMRPTSLKATPIAAKPSRAAQMMASVQSVQETPKAAPSHWPRWRKIALWAVMLTPVYAIIIYLVGGVYLAQAGLSGIGVNKSFQTHVLKVVDGISVPDQKGTFLQTGDDPMQPLNLVMEYNDRALKPPLDQQFTVAAGDLRYLLIRQSAVSAPSDYRIFQIDRNNVDHPVPGIVARRVPVARIALISLALPPGRAWAPGQYVIVSPDLDGSDFYYYFFTVTK